MLSFDFKNKLPSFWTIQLIGWVVYFVVMYVTYLSLAEPENLLNLLFVKGFRSLTGFFLTSVFLRQIYRAWGNRLSIAWLILLVLLSSSVLGIAWTATEFGYANVVNSTLELNNYLARAPRIALNYAMTLTAWSAFYLGVKIWLAWQVERENALQSAALAQQAQLATLRYQLNPHFLFNALNSIRASVDEDKNRAKRMITSLSEFLRYSLLSAENKEIPLREELEAVKNYLAIEKIRFEEKLEIEYDVETAAEDFKVPSLLLNPLVENAIKHGLQSGVKTLKIVISAKLNNENLYLKVANSGKLDNLRNSNGTKIGLKNVRERLEKLYGEKGSLQLKEEDGFVTSAIEIRR